MVCVKKSNILSRVFVLQIRPGKVVLYILERKEWFLDPKSKVLKSPKIGNFSNWLVQDFCRKIEYFIKGVYFANYNRKDQFLIFLTGKNDF